MESYPLGPASWPVWLRKLLPYSRRFYQGALAHDAFYSMGGTEGDRVRADYVFLELCLENCETSTQRFFALQYFWLVRKFGGAFFRYSACVKSGRG